MDSGRKAELISAIMDKLNTMTPEQLRAVCDAAREIRPPAGVNNICYTRCGPAQSRH